MWVGIKQLRPLLSINMMAFQLCLAKKEQTYSRCMQLLAMGPAKSGHHPSFKEMARCWATLGENEIQNFVSPPPLLGPPMAVRKNNTLESLSFSPLASAGSSLSWEATRRCALQLLWFCPGLRKITRCCKPQKSWLFILDFHMHMVHPATSQIWLKSIQRLPRKQHFRFKGRNSALHAPIVPIF